MFLYKVFRLNLVLILFTGIIQAQTRPDTTGAVIPDLRLKMNDGTEIVGKRVSEDSLNLILRTTSMGELRISKANISETVLIRQEDIKLGKYWFKNPNATRYLIGPSSFDLEPGEGYYQNIYVLFQSFNVGLIRHFSMGGGFEILSLTQGYPVFFLTPKVGFSLAKNLGVGAGLLYVNLPKEISDNDKNQQLGIGYVISTYGNENDNLTFGLGYGYTFDEISDKPVVTFSGMARAGRKFGIVAENWIIPDGNAYYAVLSYGVRFIGEKITVDFAFINSEDIIEDLVIGIPFVDFVVKF